MKKIVPASLMASLIMLFAAPASADSVIQVWKCELHDGKTVEEITKLSSAWLKAARATEGGEDLEVSLAFPMAANVSNDSFNFVLVAPDAKTWGTFMAAAGDAATAEIDTAWYEVASCSSSSLWYAVDME